MKYVACAIIMTALVGKDVWAQNYSNELSLGYTATERGITDSATYDLFYTYFFAPLEASTGPLAYAELIERPSRIEIGYGFTDYDANQSIADAESTLAGFIGHYYKDNYGFLAGLIKQDGETDSALSSLKTDLDSTYYTLGAIYYPENYTRLTMAYVSGDMTISYSPISVEENSDFERIFVELEKLVFLPDNKYVVFSGLFAREELKDVFGTVDGTELELQVDFFFTRYSGVSVTYGIFDGENSERQDAYRFGYESFLNENMSLGLFYQHDVGDMSSDTKEYALQFIQRFE